MKPRRIESYIKKKFVDWVNSIDDDHVRALVLDNTIITGGFIASLLLGEKPKDLDVYFTNKETVLAVAEHYTQMFNDLNGKIENRIGVSNLAFVLDGDKDIQEQVEAAGHNYHTWGSRMIMNLEPGRVKIIVRSDGVADETQEKFDELGPDGFLDAGDDIHEDGIEKYYEACRLKKSKDNPAYRPVFLSSNAITLSDRVQVCIRFYGDVEAIHRNFDFVHCTGHWHSDDGKLVLPADALEALLTRRLVYNGSLYPICSMIRTRKFLGRGFTIDAGQYLKMAMQITELDLSNPNVLEDQLIGVDTMYFMVLVTELRAALNDRSDIDIDRDYVCTLIDRIFS